jgi:hypothetical protein
MINLQYLASSLYFHLIVEVQLLSDRYVHTTL